MVFWGWYGFGFAVNCGCGGEDYCVCCWVVFELLEQDVGGVDVLSEACLGIV